MSRKTANIEFGAVHKRVNRLRFLKMLWKYTLTDKIRLLSSQERNFQNLGNNQESPDPAFPCGEKNMHVCVDVYPAMNRQLPSGVAAVGKEDRRKNGERG